MRRQLVLGDWWTRASLRTDQDGSAALRAFHGRHELRLRGPDGALAVRTVDLISGGRTLYVVLGAAAPQP